MKYLLDTNICVYLIKRAPETFFARFRDLAVGDVGVSAITCSELEYGVANSSRPDQNRLALQEFLAPLEILPYDAAIAPVYGRIRADLRRRGRPIGPLDLLIAAHALHLGVVLTTHNAAEFRQVRGLIVEDWGRP